MAKDEGCSNHEQKVINILGKILNVIIFLLIISLFIVILRELYELFFVNLFNGEIKEIVDVILFTFILIELFTILISYLKKNYIKVERIVEVAIISIVRELLFIIEGIVMEQAIAIGVILLVLGVLFFIEKHFSRQRNV